MLNYCSDCRNSDETRDQSEELEQFDERIEKLKASKNTFYRPIDNLILERTLYEAILFPEKAKGIKFPCAFQIPTYCFQQKTSFTIATNSMGNAFLQVNFGQYLDASMFKTGIDGIGSAGQNTLGYFNNLGVNNRNGTSTVGNSNVFVCNDVTLNNTSTVANTGNIMQAVNVMQVQTGLFNNVRAGPASIKYDYIGRLDISAGTITSGINYTAVSDPVGVTTASNGLLPEVNYSVLSSLEDSPFAITSPVTDSQKIVYVPQDFSAMNLRSSSDSTTTVIPQRAFMLISSAPPSQTVARITITQNWEGIPSKSVADILTLSYNNFPCEFDGKGVFNHIITNNLIVSKGEDDITKHKFAEQYKRY